MTIVRLLLAPAVTVAALAAPAAEPARTEVAETWADLIDREPLDAGRGVRVRLGIEASERPQWSGVLLYCLYHEPDQFFGLHTENADALGPLRVRVRHESERGDPPRWLHDHGLAGSSARPVVRDARLLFAKPVPLPKAGLYTVEVYSRDDRPLASCGVRSVAPGVHPWMPFAVDWEERRAGRPLVRNAAEGIALPYWDRTTVLLFDGKVDGTPFARDRGHGLPTFVPRSVDPTLRLSLKEDLLEVTSEERIFAREEHYFLVRWWVNGDSHVPRQTERLARQATGQTPWTGRWSARLQFVPERCGAKPGDKVELQVLYCVNGWEYVTEGRQQQMRQQSPDLKGNGPVRMSNRVEFRVK